MTEFPAQFLILWTSDDEHVNRLFETPVLTYVSYKNTLTYIFSGEILLKMTNGKKWKSHVSMKKVKKINNSEQQKLKTFKFTIYSTPISNRDSKSMHFFNARNIDWT